MSGSEQSSEPQENKPPLFENEDHGITVWADTDRNGNAFLRLRLPLGLGSIPLFVNDSGYSRIQDALNQFVDQVQQK